MIKEEKILQSRFGRQNPFVVPDGYFEQLSDRLMDNLPERPARHVVIKPTFGQRFRPVLLAAASVVGIVFGIGIYQHVDKQAKTMVAQKQSDAAYSEIDEAADCLMLDNEDIYAYVSAY